MSEIEANKLYMHAKKLCEDFLDHRIVLTENEPSGGLLKIFAEDNKFITVSARLHIPKVSPGSTSQCQRTRLLGTHRNHLL